MDKKNVFWMIGVFVIGAIIGGIIVCLICCNHNYCCMKSCKDRCQGKHNPLGPIPGPGPALISVDSANTYFKCYMKTPLSIDTLVAFSVNMEQLEAMQLLLKNDTGAKGFRIYMGMVGDPTPVDMVVATDAAGTDNASAIYMTSASGPCPDLCDKTSPITK